MSIMLFFDDLTQKCIMNLIESIYSGASRNSFNDGVLAFLLGSEELVNSANFFHFPVSQIPAPISPEKMFVFGAVSGAAKGAACRIFEAVDRHALLNLQTHHETIFKILILTIAFFVAYKTTSLLKERFDLPSMTNRSVLVLESFDFLHQLCAYQAPKRRRY